MEYELSNTLVADNTHASGRVIHISAGKAVNDHGAVIGDRAAVADAVFPEGGLAAGGNGHGADLIVHLSQVGNLGKVEITGAGDIGGVIGIEGGTKTGGIIDFDTGGMIPLGGDWSGCGDLGSTKHGINKGSSCGRGADSCGIIGIVGRIGIGNARGTVGRAARGNWVGGGRGRGSLEGKYSHDDQ